ncbi:DUF938 domain-containing protein [Psychromonas antarctica]|uniref:DUF938 domain-containing protein n=1 Tax=Psychromonas antarctica TaxID=67573 RepID=UPI001EE7B518|nr:DUF938 domain-containing protein [Psychromonas antarctica]MCG6202487.1 class I SAM-dependent methyltransferase [Psychromonas antarctica]
MPHLTWQTTDQGDYFPQLKVLMEKQRSTCLPAPLLLDVNQPVWPIRQCEFIFTANTLHIMSWQSVKKLFNGIQRSLQPAGDFCIYGPFNYAGKYTSSSNEAFAMRLKENNPSSGIRDIEKIISLADGAELELIVDYAMPANNRLLHFRKNSVQAL